MIKKYQNEKNSALEFSPQDQKSSFVPDIIKNSL